MNTTTSIYAIYRPGDTSPAYIGSHADKPPKCSGSLTWRYANCRYVGQGVWIDAEGAFMSFPNMNRETRWGSALLAMSPQERLALRVETLATVDSGDRWRAEAEALRAHKPPFNALLPVDADTKRGKYNAYMRGYLSGYYAARPEKAAAKRQADMLRARAKRAAIKAAKQHVA